MMVSGAQAEGPHPEGFAGTVVSRSGNTIGLAVEPGVEFGRQEELWIYKKRDAIQIGDVTVKVNWVRIGKIRIISSEIKSAKALILEEDRDSAIAIGNEVGRLPNTPPRIISVESDSLKIRPKHEVNIFVRAEDDEGDTLKYFAQAADGKLLHSGGDQSPVMQWVAPEEAGAYEIALRISDEKGGIADGKVVVEVLPVSAKDPYKLAGVVGGDRDDAWQLGSVSDIEIDERDNMWVVDGEKKLLRITSPTSAELGVIDLRFGRSAFGVDPSNLCFTDDGFVHVLDASHRMLDRLDKRGEYLNSVFDNSNRGDFLLEAPSDIESTRNGDVLVADYVNGHVVTIDKKGRFVLLFAAQGTGYGQLLNPVSLATNEYGDIFVLDAGKGEIIKFDNSFRFLTSYQCPLEGKTGKILVDKRSDAIFILDGTAGSVRKLEGGKLKDHVAPIVGEDLSGPRATSMAVTSNGNIFIGTEHASVWEFDGNGNLRGILGEERIDRVPSIAVTDDGELFVLDSSATEVKRFDRHRWLRARFGEQGMYEGQFKVPARICVDGEGNSYVFDSRKYSIQRFSAAGVFDKLLPIGEEVAGNLKDAADMYIRRDGTLYVLDAKRKSVFILSRDGELLKIVPFTASGSRSGKQIKHPADVAVDEEGIIYVTDPSQYAVFRFDAEGKRIGQLGGRGNEAGQFGKIEDIAVDGRGFSYVLLKDRCVAAKFDKNGRFVTEIPLAVNEQTSLKSPEVIAVDSFGTLYAYDSYYRAVFKFMR